MLQTHLRQHVHNDSDEDPLALALRSFRTNLVLVE